jgi:ABC-type glycerol-3-phosphate transport system substrate-binding protein
MTANVNGPHRRGLLGGLLAGAVALAMVGFGGASAAAQEEYAPPSADGPQIFLRLATNAVGVSPMAAILPEIIAQFQADYPNVSVAYEGTPGNDHQTKIKLDATSNRLPDLFSYWRMDPSFGLDQIVDSGRIADLTEWAENDPAFEGLFDESSWATATRDEVVRGIPFQMFYVYFGANPAVFERAGVELPTSWEELVAATDALEAAGENAWGISIGRDSQGGRIYNFVVNRLIGNERALRIHSGQEPFNTPEMIEAAELVASLVVGKTPEDAIAIDNNTAYAKYVNDNRGAMWVDGSFALAQLSEELLSTVVPLDFPLIPGGVETEFRVERDLTSMWYVSSRSYEDDVKRPYIQELIRRLTSRDAAQIYAERAKVPVPTLGVEIDPEAVGPAASITQEKALSAPANKWIPTVMTPDARAQFEPLLSEFLDGRHTPEEFVQQADVIFSR